MCGKEEREGYLIFTDIYVMQQVILKFLVIKCGPKCLMDKTFEGLSVIENRGST